MCICHLPCVYVRDVYVPSLCIVCLFMSWLFMAVLYMSVVRMDVLYFCAVTPRTASLRCSCIVCSAHLRSSGVAWLCKSISAHGVGCACAKRQLAQASGDAAAQEVLREGLAEAQVLHLSSVGVCT